MVERGGDGKSAVSERTICSTTPSELTGSSGALAVSGMLGRAGSRETDRMESRMKSPSVALSLRRLSRAGEGVDGLTA